MEKLSVSNGIFRLVVVGLVILSIVVATILVSFLVYAQEDSPPAGESGVVGILHVRMVNSSEPVWTYSEYGRDEAVKAEKGLSSDEERVFSRWMNGSNSQKDGDEETEDWGGGDAIAVLAAPFILPLATIVTRPKKPGSSYKVELLTSKLIEGKITIERYIKMIGKR